MQEAHLGRQNGVLPPEFAGLVGMRHLNIAGVGGGFNDLLASLRSLHMGIVLLREDGTVDEFIIPGGRLPDLHHLANLRSLQLPDSGPLGASSACQKPSRPCTLHWSQKITTIWSMSLWLPHCLRPSPASPT